MTRGRLTLGPNATSIPVCRRVFAAMTIGWCLLAHRLVHHRTLGAPIRRWGGRLLPFVLVALGVWIFVEAGTCRTFTR